MHSYLHSLPLWWPLISLNCNLQEDCVRISMIHPWILASNAVSNQVWGRITKNDKTSHLIIGLLWLQQTGFKYLSAFVLSGFFKLQEEAAKYCLLEPWESSLSSSECTTAVLGRQFCLGGKMSYLMSYIIRPASDHELISVPTCCYPLFIPLDLLIRHLAKAGLLTENCVLGTCCFSGTG